MYYVHVKLISALKDMQKPENKSSSWRFNKHLKVRIVVTLQIGSENIADEMVL